MPSMPGHASSASKGSSGVLRALLEDTSGGLGSGLGGGVGGLGGGLGGGGGEGGGLGGGGLGGGGEHGSKHDAAPTNDVAPGGHGMQTTLLKDAANVPAAHGVHDEAPVVADAVPALQYEQKAVPV